MANDKKHLERVDLKDIFSECERITAKRYRALQNQVDIDDFVITEEDYTQLLVYAIDAAADIASRCSYVQTSNQTPLEALSYTKEDTLGDGVGRDDFEKGQKLYLSDMPEILFDFEGVDTMHLRYTVVQQFIRAALRYYILSEYYETVGLFNDSAINRTKYDEAVGKVNFNAVVNNNRKGKTRPYRYY